jgi:preprotein translocase subunit SecD
VVHQNEQWYLEPSPFLCAPQITGITIDKAASPGSYDATVAVTREGRQNVAKATSVVGERIAIAVFGNIYSIPLIVGPIDSDTAKITFPEDQLSLWQHVAESVEHR